MLQTSVRDFMKKDPIIISADSTLRDAAEKMASLKCGVLPVGTPDKLEGVITDRDIIVEAVARGKNPERELVRDHMTLEVRACKEADTLSRAAELMREHHISRVIVEDENGKPSGILSFGSIIRKSGSMGEIASVIECAVGRKSA